jgi:hypothetical protein
MPSLDAIYDRAFFEEWGPKHDKYVKSAETIADVLHDLLRPKRLVDLGAGCGVYGHRFAMLGVEVVSIDGVTPPAEHSYPVPLETRDLTEPFENVWGRFDIALCLEVAEHIPEPLAGTFLDNIMRFSDRLILSAAQPNQGGHHHVNERPKRYWVAKLAEKGWAYNRRETGRLLTVLTAERPPYMWMVEQISVYDRVKAPPGRKDRLPFAVEAPR